MQDRGDQGKEFVQWHTQLGFGIRSGICMRLSSSDGVHSMNDILLVDILTPWPA